MGGIIIKNGGMTLREATQEWGNGFNAIPTTMIAKLWNADPEDWQEVTRPEVGDSIYAYSYGLGEIIQVNTESNKYVIGLNNGKTILLDEEQMEVEYDGQLPMWGTKWSFGDSLDNDWLEE